MKYIIVNEAGTGYKRVSISERDWKSISRSIEDLYFILSLEEVVALITDAFFDWERSLKDFILEDLVYWPNGPEARAEKKLLFVRKLVTILTVSRMYKNFIDELGRNGAYAASNINTSKRKLMRAFNNNVKSDPSCRLLQELRNYAQHTSIPITAIGRHIELRQGGENEGHALRARVVLNRSKISIDSNLSKLLYEICPDRNEIELDFHVRTFVARLREAHENVKREYEGYFRPAVSCLEAFRGEFFSSYGEEERKTALYAKKCYDNDDECERIGMSYGLIEEIYRLQRRNKMLSHLANTSIPIEVNDESFL